MPRRRNEKKEDEAKEEELCAKELTPDAESLTPEDDSPAPHPIPVSVDLNEPPVVGIPVDLENQPSLVGIPVDLENQPSLVGIPVDLENEPPDIDVPVDLENEPPVVGIPVDSENEPPVVGEPVHLEDEPPVVVDLENERPEVRRKIEVVRPEHVPLNVGNPQPEPNNEPKMVEKKPNGEHYVIAFPQPPRRFRFTGKTPAMAFNNNNQAVVVFHHYHFFWDMFCCIGKLNPTDGIIEWEDEHRYDQGSYPRVAVNNSGVVVQVHESPRKRKTWYHVGMIEGSKIEWGPSYEIGQGLHPAVALSDDDQVVIVEESGGRLFSPESFYFFGKVNRSTKTILFSRKRELLVHSGKELSVAMKGNNIIVAFRHARNHNRLHTMLGKIDGLNVSWAEYEFLCFAEGNWPSVSLNSEGVVVVNWQSYINRRVWCREGQLKETDGLLSVQWSTKPAREYNHGVYPSLCLLENNKLIAFHGSSKVNGHSMWYTVGEVTK